jgi:transcriptional regulator with XRE-family HTH domain
MKTTRGTMGNPELAAFLKEKRKAAGLSQGAVSKKMGYTSPQFVSNWERDLSHPATASLDELAQAYGCEPASFKEEYISLMVKAYERELRAAAFPEKKKHQGNASDSGHRTMAASADSETY